MILLELMTGDRILKVDTWLVQLTTCQRTKLNSLNLSKLSDQVKHTTLTRVMSLIRLAYTLMTIQDQDLQVEPTLQEEIHLHVIEKKTRLQETLLGALKSNQSLLGIKIHSEKDHQEEPQLIFNNEHKRDGFDKYFKNAKALFTLI